MFRDRTKELTVLEDLHGSTKAEFVVIYGRRRIGKTTLIEKFIEDKKGVRLLAREESEKKQLQRFSERLGDYFHDRFLLSNPFSNWDAFFTYLEERADERVVVALDEFPYLVDANPSLPSILQEHWDSTLKESKIFLILCGSSVSMMEREVLGHKSPLYGRRTSQLLLKPMTFYEMNEFLPKKETEELIQFYAVFGGVPAYLEVLDPAKGIYENILENILSRKSYLTEDVMFLLREELRAPRTYFSILEAIAHGNTTLGGIMNDTGVKRSKVAKYLSVLNDLQIIQREIPVTASKRSRRGIYTIRDNFFRFWFRFLYPNKEYLEIGNRKYLLDQVIKVQFNAFVSRTFEDVCRQYLALRSRRNEACMTFSKLGRWWYKDTEIDIVALNDREETILVGECKWRVRQVDQSVLGQLETKAKQIRWKEKKRKETYALFSRSGFTETLKQLKRERDDLLLFDLKDLNMGTG